MSRLVARRCRPGVWGPVSFFDAASPPTEAAAAPPPPRSRSALLRPVSRPVRRQSVPWADDGPSLLAALLYVEPQEQGPGVCPSYEHPSFVGHRCERGGGLVSRFGRCTRYGSRRSPTPSGQNSNESRRNRNAKASGGECKLRSKKRPPDESNQHVVLQVLLYPFQGSSQRYSSENQPGRTPTSNNCKFTMCAGSKTARLVLIKNHAGGEKQNSRNCAQACSKVASETLPCKSSEKATLRARRDERRRAAA